MRRPRPYIPYSVRIAVAARQADELGLRLGCDPAVSLKDQLKQVLRFLFGDEPSHLDHDPPLAARPYNPRIKNVAARYTPNANDPDHLIYRLKEKHRVKTYIRGEHGQYSDVVLIKRERRRQRKQLPGFGPDNRWLGNPPKKEWPKRKLQSRSSFVKPENIPKAVGHFLAWKRRHKRKTKNHPGQFDCLAKLDPNEPFFVLRAQDSEAADLVELWAIRAQTAGCHNDKVNEAFRVADDMRRWHIRKKPD